MDESSGTLSHSISTVSLPHLQAKQRSLVDALQALEGLPTHGAVADLRQSFLPRLRRAPRQNHGSESGPYCFHPSGPCGPVHMALLELCDAFNFNM